MKYIIILSLACFASCTQKEKDPMQQLEKLAGTWQTNNSEADMYEEWTKPQNGVMYGKGYLMNGTDSMVSERVELKKQGADILYMPTVKDQNNSQPVAFRLISSNDSSFIFENKTHDFPQRVIYKFIGNDSMIGRIEGIYKGQEDYQEWSYHRVRAH